MLIFLIKILLTDDISLNDRKFNINKTNKMS